MRAVHLLAAYVLRYARLALLLLSLALWLPGALHALAAGPAFNALCSSQKQQNDAPLHAGQHDCCGLQVQPGLPAMALAVPALPLHGVQVAAVATAPVEAGPVWQRARGPPQRGWIVGQPFSASFFL
ncbi:hypothetical protein SAMN02745857_04378 [Andreprevotia lacus DSM 23236]|jgi:hypothetical protein|uniref:DUF2946 domain-containing protein n=1 Tax=Andreprevotia lacus DSM 23236 TaxID=1121001 RepID=A0A1W1Y1D6_9NEIS|nr:hypothetical protein [Andreprevotia lacus]SMC30030.1 hypothetical protein SAMN02745857_04378 [Andreprevotia lacus DSM 23236]